MTNELFTILIVEDEGVVAADLAERLKQTGYAIAVLLIIMTMQLIYLKRNYQT